MIHKSHLGVYALIFNDTRDRILTIKKARGPYTGRYDLPGGSMEDGETLEETLKREIQEETNCAVKTATQIGAFSTLFEYIDSNGNESCLRHVGIVYNTEISGTPTTEGDGQDSHGCHWLPLHEAEADLTTSPMLRAAMAGR